MANRYLNNDYGFISDVFGCRIILSVIGITLITNKRKEKELYTELHPTLTVDLLLI